MFGTARFVLALLVVATPLGVWIWPGMYAVFGFFVISGYLMCLILDRRYGFTIRGFLASSTTRALRIYPPYRIAALLSLALLTALGQEAATAHWPHWELPNTTRAWLDNFVLVTLPSGPARHSLQSLATLGRQAPSRHLLTVCLQAHDRGWGYDK